MLKDTGDVASLLGGFPGGGGSTGFSHTNETTSSFLVETAWELSLRYQPMGFAFSQWIRPTLDRRVTDWLRKEFFDARYLFEPPEVISLDADDSGLNELGATHTGSSVDDGSYRLADQLRGIQA